MQIIPYNPFVKNVFNIKVAENSFYIQKKTPQNADHPLITLLKIEHVLLNLGHLKYDKKDKYTFLSREDLYATLKQKAVEIHDNYIQEQSQRNRIGRLLFSNERPINDVFARIESPDTKISCLGAPIFPLNKNATLKVMQRINNKDLTALSETNRQGNRMVKKTIVSRIQKLGCEDNDYKWAIFYKKALKREMNLLWQFNLIDQNGINTWPFLVKIKDEEQLDLNLKKLKKISNENLIYLCSKKKFYGGGFSNLKDFLSLNFKIKDSLSTEDKDREVQAKALCQAARFRHKGILKLLLKMGVNPASKYENRTALDIARETGNVECIEILAQAMEKRFFENARQSQRHRGSKK